MKLKFYFLFVFCLCQFLSFGQTFSDTQDGTNPTINFPIDQNCIAAAELQITEFTNLPFPIAGCSSGAIDYQVLVNGTSIGSCSLTGTIIDLSPYFPIASLSISVNENSFNDTLRLSATLTLNTELAVPSFSPINYNQNDTASALTATVGENGTGLLWYTTAIGGTGSTQAPTPDTSIVGNTSYWVSTTYANGCESERVEIVVFVNSLLPATHLNFDGVNDYVSLTHFERPDQFTIEAWIKTSSSIQNTIVSWGTIGGTFTSEFKMAGGRLVYAEFDQSTINFQFATSSMTINDNDWHHVSVTRTNDSTGNVLLYIDGVLDAIGTVNINVVTTELNIGALNFTGNQQFFDGSIDEVRIWDEIRSANQISGSQSCELKGNETGLISYYQFNQGLDSSNNISITSLTDATTNGNDGTLNSFALTGTTSNWLAGSPVTTGSIIPSSPSVTSPVIYNQNDIASALTATIGTNGTGLLWYTTATGGTSSTQAPTPDTTIIGSTSYWVSSTNANGCESERVEIVVTVDATLSTNEVSLNKDFNLFPNPTSNEVSIVFNQSNDVNVEVYDMRGRLLIIKHGITSNAVVALNHLTSGTYLFKISTSRGEIIKRIIKN